MGDEEWGDSASGAIMVFLNGQAIPEPDERGNPLVDDDFVMLFNSSPDPVTFTLPGEAYGQCWVCVIDTAADVVDGGEHDAGAQVEVDGRSVVVLRNRREAGVTPTGANPLG